MHAGFCLGDLNEGDPGIDGRIILLKCFFKKWADCCGSGYGQVVGACECGNEHSGSIKCGEFLHWLRTG